MKTSLSWLLMICILNGLPLFGATYNWTGVIGPNWSDLGNWLESGVVPSTLPSSSDDVIIPASVGDGNVWPTLNGTGNCKSITINGTFNLSLNWLNVYGDFTNNGTFSAGTGTVRFRGATQHIYGSSTFYDIYQADNTTTSIVFHANQTVSNLLQFSCALNTGNYTLTGGNQLTITSTGVLEIGGTGDLSSFSSLNISEESTVKYKGTNQNIGKASTAVDYGAIYISGSGTKTLIGNIRSRLNITVESGTLDLDSYSIGVVPDYDPPYTDPTFVLQSGTTLKVGGSSTPDRTLSYHSTSTVEFCGDGAGTQNMSNGDPYPNLTLSGTATKWVPGNITVNGTLTFYSGITISDTDRGRITVTNSNYHYAGPDAQTMYAETYQRPNLRRQHQNTCRRCDCQRRSGLHRWYRIIRLEQPHNRLKRIDYRRKFIKLCRHKRLPAQRRCGLQC